MTNEQRTRILELAKLLRAKAEPVGPMHSLWSLIFDLEAFADDRQTVLVMNAEGWIAFAEKLLSDSR